MIALKTDGTVWAWGDNTSGQLGQSNLTLRSSPVQVGSATTWKSITIGNKGVGGVKT
jgi:alpha-tubulin suppressor-like RCC1 family protein